jgi:hypothetical protein
MLDATRNEVRLLRCASTRLSGRYVTPAFRPDHASPAVLSQLEREPDVHQIRWARDGGRVEPVARVQRRVARAFSGPLPGSPCASATSVMRMSWRRGGLVS